MTSTLAILCALLALTIMMDMSVMSAPTNPQADRTLSKRTITSFDPLKHTVDQRSVIITSPTEEDPWESRDSGPGCDGSIKCKRSKQETVKEEKRSVIEVKDNAFVSRDSGPGCDGAVKCKRSEQETGKEEKRSEEVICSTQKRSTSPSDSLEALNILEFFSDEQQQPFEHQWAS
ncbi:uncharacterized protein FA14DRAFT_157889 [Meira miltonrushii]|uniref:Uncharacterized protein n=1 Tax=Meira miltonrushii TaxID=1280837 RepID=A0A316V312_9BASI|nr:uncharacterized protein FA14DRAFT_157889 [Meira miltonrushii]PWN31947.1 hypothetical protein FA14DRAFT_157889 [Meira miltonrushii]